MQRLFSAYEAHREDPARLLGLDVFNWEDVMTNSIYADGLQCLGALCREAGYPLAEAAEFERRGRRVLGRARREVLGRTQRACSGTCTATTSTARTTLTFTSLFPLILDSLDRHMV